MVPAVTSGVSWMQRYVETAVWLQMNGDESRSRSTCVFVFVLWAQGASCCIEIVGRIFW